MHWSERDTPEPERTPEPQGALVPPARRPPTAVGTGEEDPFPKHPQWRPRHSPWVLGSDAPDAPAWLRAVGQAFDAWLAIHGGAVRLEPRIADERDTQSKPDDRAA
jgi:hypothetical protein